MLLNAARMAVDQQRHDDPVEVLDHPEADTIDLSLAAATRKTAMEMLVHDLPPDLPWEILKDFKIGECFQCIKDLMEVKKSDNPEETNMESATKVWNFPAAPDDCFNKLHPARWLRAPLAPPVTWWKHVPLKLSHTLSSLPLEHLSLENSFAPPTIRKLHDRTKAVALNQLLTSNWSVETTAPRLKRQKFDSLEGGEASVGLVNEWDYKEPTSASQVQEAIQSYVAVMQHLHPFDWGPSAISITLSKMQYFHGNNIDKKEQLASIRAFADKAFLTNAGRASNKVPPLTVRELEDMALNTLRVRGRPAVFPLLRDFMAAGQPSQPNTNQPPANQKEYLLLYYVYL